MKKISKVIIKNFQSHKHTELNFDNFTAIVGPTDSGKSAIIRAIKWALYNEPSGTDFIRQGENFTEVIVEFDDGSKIRRYRSKNKNLYELTNAQQETIILENFGSGPVDEVVALHGMPKVEFLGELQSLNICDQLANPFFLSQSAAERAIALGKIAHTDIIDIAIKNVLATQRELKALQKSYLNTLDELQNKLQLLPDIDQLFNDLLIIKQKRDTAIQLINTIAKIKLIQMNLNELTKKQQALQQIISEKDFVQMALQNIDKLINLLQVNQKVQNIFFALQQTEKEKIKLQNILCITSVEELNLLLNNCLIIENNLRILNSVKNFYIKLITNQQKLQQINQILNFKNDLQLAIQNLESIDLMFGILKQVINVYNNITQLLQRKQKGDIVLEQLKTNLSNAISQYKQILIDLQKCPVCFSPIDTEQIDKILQNI